MRCVLNASLHIGDSGRVPGTSHVCGAATRDRSRAKAPPRWYYLHTLAGIFVLEKREDSEGKTVYSVKQAYSFL